MCVEIIGNILASSLVVLKDYLLIKLTLVIIGFLLYLVIDFVAFIIINLNYKIYHMINGKLVSKPSLLVTLYKIHLKIRQLSWSMERGVSRRVSRWFSKKKWSDTIYRDSSILKLKQLLILFFDLSKISTYLAILLTVYNYRSQLSSWISFNSVWINRENIEFLLLILPTITIFFGLIYMRRFVSLKGRFKRGANKLNQQLIIETLDVHRKLTNSLSPIIYEGTQNLDNVIKQKNMLTEARLKEISPLIERVEDDEVIWRETTIHRGFHSRDRLWTKEIKEIKELATIIEEVNKDNLFKETLWIKHYQDEMFGLRFLDSNPETLISNFERYLFTPTAVKKIVKNPNDEINYGNIQELEGKQEKQQLDNKILRDIARFEQEIDYHIINSIEVLVELSQYHKAAHKLLHFNSNKIERTLDSWITKE